jgi:potassium efflux system protein
MLRQIEQAGEQFKQTVSQLDALNTDFDSVQGRVEAAGNTEAIGVLLRNRRASLPDTADLRRNTRLRAQTLASVQLKQLEYEEERNALRDIEAVIDSQLDELAPNATQNQRENMAALLRDVYTKRQSALDAQQDHIQPYIDTLLQLDAEERKLIDAAQRFENFIDEHILWIQSGSTIALTDIRGAGRAFAWLGSIDNLVQIPNAIFKDYLNNPVPRTVIYAFPIVLLLSGRMIRKRVLDLGDQASKRRCTVMAPTLTAAVFVLVWSAGPPLLLGVIGWR